jgi:hypothetical protein
MRAILTMNLQGGGGFELWQFLDRVPSKVNTVNLGDIGIFAAIIKSADIYKSHQRLSNISGLNTSKLNICESGIHYFYVTDSQDNTFKIVPSDDWFQKDKHDLGGVIGNWSVKYRKVDRVLQTILGLDTYFMISKSMKIIIISEKLDSIKALLVKVLLINY